jgi:hypothetical protein
MRKWLARLAATLTLGLALSANLLSVGPMAIASDDPYPCDPPPTHFCEARGGTFNYVTCRCEFP